MNSTLPKHTDLEELIPWYVNGTLAEDEMEHMTRHLQECPECRGSIEREMAFARSYSADTRSYNLDSAIMESALNKLIDTLDEQPAQRKRTAARISATVTMAISLLLVSAVFMIRTLPVNDQEYRTLTTPSQVQAGTVYQVVFHDEEPSRDIRQAIEISGLEIISGPSPQGVYRLAISPHVEPSTAMQELASRVDLLMMEQELR